MHFNPADIQTIGVGLAAFLASLTAIFIFLSARKESLGRSILFVLCAMSLWAWFGFLYEIVSNLAIARGMRIVSVMGIVGIAMATLNFSIIYIEERMHFQARNKRVLQAIIMGGVVLILGLLIDLFGGRLIVGDLTLPTNEVLAPNAGPLFGLIIVYYALCTSLSAVFLALRARASTDIADRRRVELIMSSLTIALVLGGTRFAPWYGFDSYPLLGMFAGPLFIFTAFYTIKRYKLFNTEVAIAQLLIFLLWTFSFFHMLVGLGTPTATIDIIFFVGVLVLGIYLIRTMIVEMQTQKRLIRLSLEQSKSEFATIAAHELREPFTIIQSVLMQLSSGKKSTLTEPQQRLVRQGKEASHRLISLLDNLLNIVHISKGTLHFDMELGDIRNAVRSGTNIFEEALKNKNIQFKLTVPDEPLKARFDRGKLVFAIENVFDNAIKYTPVDGSITVDVVREAKKIHITISDSGIGINDSDLSRIFEKFFRTEAAVHMVPDGSGLGLYLAKGIIEAHGGTITLTSPNHIGTVATIVVPALPH